jgi:hypothetical protein
MMTPDKIAQYLKNLELKKDNDHNHTHEEYLRQYFNEKIYTIVLDFCGHYSKIGVPMIPISISSNACPTSNNIHNSILLQRLAIEAKFFSSDYKYPFVVKTIAELTNYEDDDRLISSFAKNRRKNIDIFLKEYCKKYIKTHDPDLKQEIITRLSTPTRFNPVFFNGMRCDVCSQTNATKCSRCKIASYCNSDCQKKDYIRHKPVCLVLSRIFLHQLEKNSLQFGKEIATQIVNNIWTITSANLSSEVVDKEVLLRHVTESIGSVEESRSVTTSTAATADKGEVTQLLVLYEWLETHFSPCTLSIDCNDGKSTCGWITSRSNTICSSCKSKTAVFCRSCTMINACDSCHSILHSKDKCTQIVEVLNTLVKRISYRANTY